MLALATMITKLTILNRPYSCNRPLRRVRAAVRRVHPPLRSEAERGRGTARRAVEGVREA